MKKTILISLLCLFWIQGYNSSKLAAEPSFHIIPLGHNSLLIKWKLPANKVKGFTHYIFSVTKVSASVTEINRVSAINGHISSYILALKTNTRYKISVEIRGTNFEEPFRTVLEAKTNEIRNTAPFKPEFEYQILAEEYAYPELKITWFPCGKQEDCGSEIAGAYFYVKYKENGSNDSIIVEEFVNDYVYVNDCRPGRVYRFVVVSVSGNYETESGPLEISFPKGPSNFKTMEAMVNEDIIIPCKLASTTDRLTWNWTSSFLNATKIRLLANGDLQIIGLESFDGGKYTCFVQNSSPPLFVVTFLHIKNRSQITNHQEFGNVIVRRGEDFQMECDFWHDESLSAQVTWLKNGGKNNLDSNTGILGYKQNIIVISPAKTENSGDYTCLVTTSFDSTNATFTLQVT